MSWYSTYHAAYTYHVYTECMSPTLNGSSVLECFERGNAIEIHNGIMV